MIYLGIACLLLLAYAAWKERCFESEREAFAREREVWVRERRDLLNRIQVPEAAPFLSEADTGPSEDDLPLLPTQTLTEDEMEAAKQALADVGYTDGPVG